MAAGSVGVRGLWLTSASLAVTLVFKNISSTSILRTINSKMAKRKNQGLIDSDSDASDDSGSDLDSVSSAAHNA